MLHSSVSATAGMPSRTQAATSALMRMVESTSEYSLCRCRWVKLTVMPIYARYPRRLPGAGSSGQIDIGSHRAHWRETASMLGAGSQPLQYRKMSVGRIALVHGKAIAGMDRVQLHHQAVEI